jgi:hypothetical protein
VVKLAIIWQKQGSNSIEYRCFNALYGNYESASSDVVFTLRDIISTETTRPNRGTNNIFDRLVNQAVGKIFNKNEPNDVQFPRSRC